MQKQLADMDRQIMMTKHAPQPASVPATRTHAVPAASGASVQAHPFCMHVWRQLKHGWCFG